MKTLKNVLPRAAIIFLIFTLLCGVVYTGIVQALHSLFFLIKQTEVLLRLTEKSTAVSCSVNSIRMTGICGGAL